MKKIVILILIGLSLSGCGMLTTTNESPITENINIENMEEHIADVIAFLDEATLAIYNKQTVEGSLTEVGQGSGVIYKKIDNGNNTYTYYVITNEHVTKDGEAFSVYDGGGASATAELVGEDAVNDIAILKFTSISTYNVVPFGSMSGLRMGNYVIAMGTPLGTNYYNTATLGIISGFRNGLIQHDAAINAGNSGGPLVDINGKLIGINVAKLSNNTEGEASIEGIGFAVGIDTVKTSVFILELGDTNIPRPILGITVTDIKTIRQALTLTREEYITGGGSGENYDNYVLYETYIDDTLVDGLFVVAVAEGSNADNAGMLAYDVITGVNEKNITTLNEFQVEIWAIGVGGSTTINVNRNGVLQTLNISF